jgi:hypothetical protein
MRRAWLTILGSAAVLGVAPPAALAVAPDEDGGGDRGPALGALTLAAQGGIDLGGRRFVLEGQRVTVEGHAARFVPGGEVTLEVSRPGGARDATQVGVQRDGARGRFRTEFVARRTGVWRIRAAEAGGSEAEAALHAVDAHARRGARALGVKLLQAGLRRLGYVTSTGGRFDGATARAVLAFRKTNGMRRRTAAGHVMLAKLFRGEGGFVVRYPRSGKHIEFDWSRQVLVLARGGRTERIYHASSGKRATPTVFGTFSFYRKTPGTNRKGMVWANYFIRGYAIHGFRSVPARPASHGCIRVPVPDAVSISRWISLGDRIHIYR